MDQRNFACWFKQMNQVTLITEIDHPKRILYIFLQMISLKKYKGGLKIVADKNAAILVFNWNLRYLIKSYHFVICMYTRGFWSSVMVSSFLISITTLSNIKASARASAACVLLSKCLNTCIMLLKTRTIYLAIANTRRPSRYISSNLPVPRRYLYE